MDGGQHRSAAANADGQRHQRYLVPRARIRDGPGGDPEKMRSLLLGGGIPKEALIEGPAAIDREIDRLLPLIREGGYLPALDDVVPPEGPFDTYRFFVNALRAVVP